MRLVFTVLLLLFAVPAAHAADYPHRKPGLWEITMAFSARKAPPMVTKLCVDADTDAALYQNSMGGDMAKMCSKRDISKSGNVTTVDSLCKIGDSNVTGHSVITETSATAYHIDHKSHMDPPIAGHADNTFTQDGKWLGACPADMKPGDMVMPTGMKMNVLDMQKAAGQH
jgi:hypothetical protein